MNVNQNRRISVCSHGAASSGHSIYDSGKKHKVKNFKNTSNEWEKIKMFLTLILNFLFFFKNYTNTQFLEPLNWAAATVVAVATRLHTRLSANDKVFKTTTDDEPRETRELNRELKKDRSKTTVWQQWSVSRNVGQLSCLTMTQRQQWHRWKGRDFPVRTWAFGQLD